VGGAYQLFAADWSKGGVHLLLNHSYIDVADLPSGFIAPRPSRIWLNVSDAATSLRGRHALDQAQYTQQQWFNVRPRRTLTPALADRVRRLVVENREHCPSGPPGTGTTTCLRHETSSSQHSQAQSWAQSASRCACFEWTRQS
jgi:hypothetical protein